MISVLCAGAEEFVLKITPGYASGDQGELVRADTERGTRIVLLTAGGSTYRKLKNAEAVKLALQGIKEIGLTDKDAELMQYMTKSVNALQYELSYKVNGEEKSFRFEKRMGDKDFMEYFASASRYSGPYRSLDKEKVAALNQKLIKICDLLGSVIAPVEPSSAEVKGGEEHLNRL